MMPKADYGLDAPGVVSMSATHNIYDADARKQAIAEIARVLAPAGQLATEDIRHVHEYEAAASARARGQTLGRRLRGGGCFALLTFGTMRPGRVVALKRQLML